jgi:hypothetical protein
MSDPNLCERCETEFSIHDGLEPTRFCDLCAQDVVEEQAREIAMLAAQLAARPVATGIEAEVTADRAQRQLQGLDHYKITLAENNLPLSARIQHAYEESIDLPNYQKWAWHEAIRLEALVVKLKAMVAERDERISELVAVATETLEVMGFEKWDQFLSYTPQFGAFVKLQRTLTRATSSKIAGGWLPVEREQMEWLDANCFDLRCENVPTGGDDADIIWIVYSHHMSKPALRAEGYGKTASKAVADAMLPKGDPKRWDYVPPEYDLPHPPESSEGLK